MPALLLLLAAGTNGTANAQVAPPPIALPGLEAAAPAEPAMPPGPAPASGGSMRQKVKSLQEQLELLELETRVAEERAKRALADRKAKEGLEPAAGRTQTIGLTGPSGLTATSLSAPPPSLAPVPAPAPVPVPIAVPAPVAKAVEVKPVDAKPAEPKPADPPLVNAVRGVGRGGNVATLIAATSGRRIEEAHAGTEIDGWRVVAIDIDGVTFRRDGATVRVGVAR